MADMTKNNNSAVDSGTCHRDHRKRLKKRFVEEGLRGFEAHNILELLLFFAIPQKDTNELAHALLERYQSVSGVFDADYQDLCRVPGVGENTATLLKLIAPLSRIYLCDKETRYTRFHAYGEIAKYLQRYYIGETREMPVILLLNNKVELIRTVPLDEGGTVSSGNINLRRVIEICLQYQASLFVLAHNHPDGDAIPSREDLMATKTVREMTSYLDLPLLEHFIVGRERCAGILHPNDGKI